MCGIYLGLHDHEISLDLRTKIANRGPDSIKDVCLNIDGHHVQLISSVLHIRGQGLCEQPVENDKFVLQWNGEVFAGIEVYPCDYYL